MVEHIFPLVRIRRSGRDLAVTTVDRDKESPCAELAKESQSSPREHWAGG